MRRRELFVGAAAAAIAAEAQQPRPATVYIPQRQRVEDIGFLQDFMDEYSFVDLVTASPTLHITHIPILLDRKAGGAHGTLFGHIARNNPQSQTFASQPNATIVFRGPHAYISPSWYAKSDAAVPTWNFGVVHASGKLKPIEDKPQLRALLSRLIAKFEARVPEANYNFDKLSDTYVNGMLGGIVGFEMPVESLEGKFKLGQERAEADRKALLNGLGKAKAERGMQDFTANFYGRKA